MQGVDSDLRDLSGLKVASDCAHETSYFDSLGESFQTVPCARLL